MLDILEQETDRTVTPLKSGFHSGQRSSEMTNAFNAGSVMLSYFFEGWRVGLNGADTVI